MVVCVKMEKKKLRIGLYNLEPSVVNSAMMQISSYHKKLGDNVELYQPAIKEMYDVIYAFSIFEYTDKSYVTPDMIKGGTGFDIKDGKFISPGSQLSEEVLKCNYDWNLYPNCDYSVIWFSRGCVRSCPFCVVRQKEGVIHSVKPKNLNPNSKFIKVMDNNFFANPKWKDAVKQLLLWDIPVDLQGVDVRLLNEEHCKALQLLRLAKNIHIAWDNPKDDLFNKMDLLTKYISPHNVTCYVLIGYWSTPEQDLMRVEKLRELKISPFAMPFNKRDKYQKKFARWVNRQELFKRFSFKEYCDGIDMDKMNEIRQERKQEKDKKTNASLMDWDN